MNWDEKAQDYWMNALKMAEPKYCANGSWEQFSAGYLAGVRAGLEAAAAEMQDWVPPTEIFYNGETRWNRDRADRIRALLPKDPTDDCPKLQKVGAVATSDRIAEIRKRAEAATPEPSHVSDSFIVGPIPSTVPDDYGNEAVAAMLDDAAVGDAAFIAHAREDIPWLLAQLTAANERAERLRRALQEIHDADGEGADFRLAGWR